MLPVVSTTSEDVAELSVVELGDVISGDFPEMGIAVADFVDGPGGVPEDVSEFGED